MNFCSVPDIMSALLPSFISLTPNNTLRKSTITFILQVRSQGFRQAKYPKVTMGKQQGQGQSKKPALSVPIAPSPPCPSVPGWSWGRPPLLASSYFFFVSSATLAELHSPCPFSIIACVPVL